ncbi:HNH endonuclease [Serratia ureilytica]|uniref:HNH endonuclease n=1 Tax=Serratia TaxID=613 RepID=UPI001AA1C60D|nr:MULTISPECIES: HNH endonuclease [Serratia]EGT0452532.1 HNH endonuclease [Serratia marcescens]MBO1811400.1 HNH endonuclease [Serratia ureilytica]MCM2654022.1 HNH endonuclease [Serratia marcescens]
MIANKKSLIVRELEEGTGAAIAAKVDLSGIRSSLRIWFLDLDEKHGPVAELRPYGLKGHQVVLTFGNFSREVIAEIQKASPEAIQLARALVASMRVGVVVEITGQSVSGWKVMDGSFHMTATLRDLEYPLEDVAIVATCRDVIVPIMAAMAELIGYDIIEESVSNESKIFEGAILKSVINRRERNPRNRLLCIRIHGEKCKVCGVEPKMVYGEAGSIIEVHHLEPVASLTEPRPYDPLIDLVPLCPSCHRAIHTRKPFPYSIEELKSQMEVNNDSP